MGLFCVHHRRIFGLDPSFSGSILPFIWPPPATPSLYILITYYYTLCHAMLHFTMVVGRTGSRQIPWYMVDPFRIEDPLPKNLQLKSSTKGQNTLSRLPHQLFGNFGAASQLQVQK